MAFGHAVKRGGFDSKISGVDIALDLDGTTLSGDDQLKGTKGDDVTSNIDGGDGDDVIIGYGGNDALIGGYGEDDISGGSGDDVLIGGDWDTAVTHPFDADGDGSVGDVSQGVILLSAVLGGTFNQDAYSDDFNAEATFEENGTDVILGYDDGDAEGNTGVYDVVDFSDTIDFVDPDPLDGPITTEEKEAQLDGELSYNTTTGELSYDDGVSDDVFFKVYEDFALTPADTVYVEVDGDQFVYDTTEGWEHVA